MHHNRKFQFVTNHLKTQSATDSYFVYVLKMEYVPKINMFGLKTLKKFLHAQSLFWKLFLTDHKIANSIMKLPLERMDGFQ